MGKQVQIIPKTDIPQICIIGAGFSGLCAAVQLERKLLNMVNFTVYESNAEVGGNWLVNSYPGCACDIQSHLYSYSFAPKPDWSKEFAPQPEILEYIKSVARKFNIYKHIQFKTQVKRLTWIEKMNKWNVVVYDMETATESEVLYDIIINGSGELRIPEIPDEFKPFKGPTIHSARWDPNIELEGKTVAVIGSGATAIQLIPSIAKRVGKLLTYQRQPAWIIPQIQVRFSRPAKWIFGHVPGYRKLYRSTHFLTNEMLFPVFESGTVMSRIAYCMATTMGKRHLQQQIRENSVQEKLIPNYRLGCKRVGISNKYYPALDLPHVHVITDKIAQVTEKSIITENDEEENIDVLILATGFRVHDYFAPMEIFGRNSENILQKWKKDGPSAFLGITTNDMPNYFILLGPGSDVNHNSGIFQIECQVRWIIKLVKEMMKRKTKYVAVKSTVEFEYMEKTQKSMMKTVYGKYKCGSWFADSRGIITSLYPKNSISYWKRTRKINYRNFEFN